jgi:hypothetical protein
MKPPTDPDDRARLGFLSLHYSTIVAVAKNYQGLGKSLDDIVIFLGDVERPDVVDIGRYLLDGIVDFDAKLEATRDIKKRALCAHIPRERVKKRLLREGVALASVLDQPAPLGTIWVLALTQQGRSLTLVSLDPNAKVPEA